MGAKKTKIDQIGAKTENMSEITNVLGTIHPCSSLFTGCNATLQHHNIAQNSKIVCFVQNFQMVVGV